MTDDEAVMKKNHRSFGQTVLQGAREAAAIARGETRPARVTRATLSAGNAVVKKPPRYDAARVKKLRRRLSVSQPVFAKSLNASDATVKAWEQGKRIPEGTSLRLLELVEKEPSVFAHLVGLPDPVPDQTRRSARSRKRSTPA